MSRAHLIHADDSLKAVASSPCIPFVAFLRGKHENDLSHNLHFGCSIAAPQAFLVVLQFDCDPLLLATPNVTKLGLSRAKVASSYRRPLGADEEGQASKVHGRDLVAAIPYPKRLPFWASTFSGCLQRPASSQTIHFHNDGSSSLARPMGFSVVPSVIRNGGHILHIRSVVCPRPSILSLRICRQAIRSSVLESVHIGGRAHDCFNGLSCAAM